MIEGAPVADGDHSLVATLYSSTGDVLFTRSYTVRTSDGLFSTTLGPFPSSIPFDQAYELGVAFDGNAELTPRTPLTSSPYSLRAITSESAELANRSILADRATTAERADVATEANALSSSATDVVRTINNVGGLVEIVGGTGIEIDNENGMIRITLDQEVTGGGILNFTSDDGTIDIEVDETDVDLGLLDGSVTSAHLEDKTIQTSDIADGAIRTAQIAASTVSTPNLMDSVVTEIKIFDGSITTPKIASEAVTTTEIKGRTIQTEDIDSAAITGHEIAHRIIQSYHLIENAVGQHELSDEAVATRHIIDRNVTTNKIDTLAVSTEKLGDGSVTMSKIDHIGANAGATLKFDGTTPYWANPTSSISEEDDSRIDELMQMVLDLQQENRELQASLKTLEKRIANLDSTAERERAND